MLKVIEVVCLVVFLGLFADFVRFVYRAKNNKKKGGRK